MWKLNMPGPILGKLQTSNFKFATNIAVADNFMKYLGKLFSEKLFTTRLCHQWTEENLELVAGGLT